MQMHGKKFITSDFTQYLNFLIYKWIGLNINNLIKIRNIFFFKSRKKI